MQATPLDLVQLAASSRRKVSVLAVLNGEDYGAMSYVDDAQQHLYDF